MDFIAAMKNTLLCLLMVIAGAGVAGGADSRPNIVFFIADDMLPRHFNMLPEGRGKNLTPHLDRLAEEGTILMGQHVASPICTPSRFNVLTGRFASRARNQEFQRRTKREGQTVVEFNTHILADDVTVQRLLQTAGYDTGMVGKNHVVHATGLKRFPDFDADVSEPAVRRQLVFNHERVRQAMLRTGFDFADRIYHNNPDFLGLHQVAVQNMEWITEGALDFISRKRDRPFFLYFATTVPHGPTVAHRSWNANPRMSAVGELAAAPQVQPARATIPDRLREAGLPVDEHTANVLWLDDALGALLNRLEATGQLANTLIFFVSDHGQMAKGTVYQGGVHNPSIVWRLGGFPAGNRRDELVHIVDFAPTLVEIAGGDPVQPQFDGQSFLPLLEAESFDRDRVLYFELGYVRGIRLGDWKFMAVRYPAAVSDMTLAERTEVLAAWNLERRRKHLNIVTEDPTQPFSHLTPIPGGGDAERVSTGAYPGYYDADQLYHLPTDPREQTNLATDPNHAAQLALMRRELRKILDDLPGDFAL